MDWRLLLGKGIFGILVVVAWSVGLLPQDVVVATLLGLISIDEIGEGYKEYKLSLKKKKR